MFLHMVHYGVKVEKEVFICLRMGVKLGKEYYTLMNIQELMKFIWTQKTQKHYMLLPTKEEGMYILMLVVAQVQVYINQQMEDLLGKK